jgi:hypothetical protein
VARADWTYEVPPFGSDAVWLEDYHVLDADGQPIGRVFDVLERQGQLYLGVDRSRMPLRHHRHAVPYEQLETIDHERAVVRLKLAADDVEQTPELDPDKAVEGGEAEARRVTEPPSHLLPGPAPPRPVGPGTIDRPLFYVAAPLFRIAGIALLAVVIVYGRSRPGLRALWFAIPAVLVLLALISAWREVAIPWGWGAARQGKRPPRR